MENCLVDLNAGQKAAYYFLSLPVWIGYRIIRLNSFGYYRSGWANYKPQGLYTKESTGRLLSNNRDSFLCTFNYIVPCHNYRRWDDNIFQHLDTWFWAFVYVRFGL